MRRVTNFNQNWRFVNKDMEYKELFKTKGEKVSIPHTFLWDKHKQRSGSFWYYKLFDTPKRIEGCRVFLEFEAVNVSCEIYLYGQNVYCHSGGHTAFFVDVSQHLKSTGKQNLLAVKVCNVVDGTSKEKECALLGGIIRNVKLIIVPHSHFAIDEFGSRGLLLNTVNTDGDWHVTISATVQNPRINQMLCMRVLNANNKVVAEELQHIDNTFFDLIITSAHIWDGVESPYLYKLEALLVDPESILDRQEMLFGLREHYLDKSGFYLNCKRLQLHCAEYTDVTKVCTPDLKQRERDFSALIEMGVNAIKTAPYKLDDDFYTLCDKLGLLVWQQNLMPHGYDETADSKLLRQLRETVVQTRNNTCVLLYGVNTVKLESDEETRAKLIDACRNVCKENNENCLFVLTLPYGENAVEQSADCAAYDYSPVLAEKSRETFTSLKKRLAQPEAQMTYALSDFSLSFEALSCIFDSPELWLVSFSRIYDEKCGVLSADRKRKTDNFYLCKVFWVKKDFVHILEHAKSVRDKKTVIGFYSTEKFLSVSRNGETVKKLNGDKRFYCEVPLHLGKNSIRVQGKRSFEEGTILCNAKFKKEELTAQQQYIDAHETRVKRKREKK